jgi:hypothetical protein
MVAFTFILRKDGSEWSAKRLADEEGEALTAEGADTYRCTVFIMQPMEYS